MSFTITDTGTGTVAFNSFTLGGTNPGDFAIVGNTCPQPASVLAAGGNCAVTFEFIPTAAGSRSATITIVDNATGTPQHFTIAGTGQTPATTLSFSPSSISFTTPITIGSTSAQTYTYVTNTGNTPIAFTGYSIAGTNAADFKITPSTSCLLNPGTLAAGGACYMYVTFSPSVNGTESANLVFNDNASGSPQSVGLTGTGQAATQTLSFSPSLIAFSATSLGSSTPNYTYVQNTGTLPVTLTSFGITGTNASDFTLSTTTNCTPLPYTLAAGAQCYQYVSFMPSGTGSRTANLVVTDSASGSPQTVGLSGSGQSSTSFTVAPTTLTFAPQNQGTSGVQPVNVYNSGSVAVTISSVAVTGTNAADFVAANNCGSSVAAASHCAIMVTFTPSATGTRTATLTVTDSGTGSPQSVTLTGTGQSAVQTIYISQTALTFAAQNLNTTSAAQYVQIVDNGSGGVTIGGVTITGTNAADFTISNNTCTTLTAGGSCYVYVTFSPSAVGSRVATLQISDTATGSPQSVNLAGTGRSTTQTISFSPTILQYASQIVGATSTSQYFYIYNYGNTNLTVNSITIAGTNASDFAITQNECQPPIALTPGGGSCYVYIAFTPTAIGNRTASVQVSDSAPGSPHTVTLVGTGQSSTSTLNISALTGVDFGQQNEYTTSAAQYFYIYNVGTAPVTINNLSLTGTNAGDFSIYQNECPMNPASIAAAGSCYIYLQFTPTTTGQEYATLQITDTATGSPHLLQLSGIGVALTEITSLQPNEIDFGTVILGGSTGATANYFYVYNKGTVPLTFSSFNITGTNSGDFSLATGTCPSSPATLAAGAGCYWYVVFTPSGVGARTASIQVSDSAPG